MRTTLASALAILVLALVACERRSWISSGIDAASVAANRDGNQQDPANGDCGGLPVQPESLRVDLYAPSFTRPTDADNPLFPVGALDRVLLLGSVDGEPLRVETTRLPGTRTIVIGGEEVETIISQYVAWIGGRIHEVALDWYGQDDAGAVWYFGEDVFNYEDGVIADTEGTWLAGREGPVAMIMPSAPRVGDAWRPENACPIVFEEVVATQTDVTVQGPRGPVTGCLMVRELHMDGSLEDKTFAPGYGEFSTGSGGDVEAVAVAVPTDALAGPVPDEVETLSDGAEQIFGLSGSGRWRRIAAIAGEMSDAWDAFRDTGVPPMLDEQMSGALEVLGTAIAGRDRAGARQASVDLALAALDLELRYGEREEIDLDLIEVWCRQLLIDMRARDRAAVSGDLATIQIIRDRLPNHPEDGIDFELGALRSAARAADIAAAERCVARFRDAR